MAVGEQRRPPAELAFIVFSCMLQIESRHLLMSSHLIGVVLTSFFYGITLAQTRCYYRSFKTDPIYMKFFVGLLWSLDTGQLVLITYSAYIYTVIGNGDDEALGNVTGPFIASMAVTSIVAFLVQTIYAYRIWHLSAQNAWITSGIMFLALFALASNLAMFVRTLRDPRWDRTSANNLPASLILVSTVATDAAIAAAQVWLLQRARGGRFGKSVASSVLASRDLVSYDYRLGGLITKLTLLVVNVGLLTSVDATLFLVLFLACPINGAFLVPYLLLSNCYLNSFLSILNSRSLLRAIVADEQDEYSTPNINVTNVSFHIDSESQQTQSHPDFESQTRSQARSCSRTQTLNSRMQTRSYGLPRATTPLGLLLTLGLPPGPPMPPLELVEFEQRILPVSDHGRA
ncbi:hypothetical protein PLICRDRAFT_177470 [Plicaturopsis crispa FD-325 SS-3]|nr:hypothetical protein PLICRDRAFT_177470 [Plicaturopsis crispa FD-325 SS-3]